MAIKQTAKLEEALRKAAEMNASDIHLAADEPMIFRVDGALKRDDDALLTAGELEEMAIAAVGAEAVEAIGQRTGEALTSCGLPGEVDGQLSIGKALGSYRVTIRVLPGAIVDLEATGAPKALIDAAKSPFGIVIIGGVTGSGKTTTAISLVDHLNATSPVHIITLEEPVCVRLVSKEGLVQQREIGVDVPDSMAGMRAAMKQDPDVLFLSGLKTQAELEALVTIAETGHMAIVQAHGSSPEDIIQRFIDVFPEEGREKWVRRFADVLRAVSVQRLLRRAGGKGRVAAYGVLTPDDESKAAMLSGDSIAKRAKPLPEGCMTMADHIVTMRDEGVVTMEAAQDALDAIG